MKHFILSLILGMVLGLIFTVAWAADCHPVRDANGNIKRSSYQVAKFKRLNPCPATGEKSGACPGYVVDHIVPLCACGVDRPSNMQYQTRADSIEKDRLERAMCGGASD